MSKLRRFIIEIICLLICTVRLTPAIRIVSAHFGTGYKVRPLLRRSSSLHFSHVPGESYCKEALGAKNWSSLAILRDIILVIFGATY